MRKPARLLILTVVMVLAACGFKLRGQESMPFETIYIDATNPNTLLISELRRILLANKVKAMDSADQASLVLNIVSEVPEKQVLSLGGDGRVNEFRLLYRVSLRAYDFQHDWIPAEEITLRNDFSYDDTKLLAKEAEENLLYRSMRSEMVQQIIRRLSYAKPQPK